jgi:phosphinothricin acetyltransferase
MLKKVKPEDAGEIAEIYNYYILNSVVTFEETPIDAEEMRSRILAHISKYPWFVYEIENQIVGYAYAGVWKTRSAYNQTVESSVYLKQSAINQGIGTILYIELIKQLKDLGIHAVIGGISLPNQASIQLHEKLGFKKIGEFKEVGYKFNKWIDVGYWELIL